LPFGQKGQKSNAEIDKQYIRCKKGGPRVTGDNKFYGNILEKRMPGLGRGRDILKHSEPKKIKKKRGVRPREQRGIS